MRMAVPQRPRRRGAAVLVRCRRTLPPLLHAQDRCRRSSPGYAGQHVCDQGIEGIARGPSVGDGSNANAHEGSDSWLHNVPISDLDECRRRRLRPTHYGTTASERQARPVLEIADYGRDEWESSAPLRVADAFAGSTWAYDEVMDGMIHRPAGLDTPALVAAAAAAGYAVSPRMLETFRAEGLMPRPLRVGHSGRAPRWESPVGSERQLLQLLRYRESTKDANVVRVLLWLDGFAVSPDLVRSSIAASLDSMLATVDDFIRSRAERSSNATRDEAVRQLAASMAARRGPKALPRHNRVKAHERARSLELVIRTLGLGEAVEVSEADARMVERALGIAPNGRRHLVDGEGPWLTGPATAMFEAAEVIALPRAAQVIKDATDTELEQARDLVCVLWRGLPMIARLIATMFDDDNYIGMAGLTLLDQEPMMVVILIPAVVGMLRAGWVENIEAIATSLRNLPDFTAEMEQVLNLPQPLVQQRMADQPPEAQQRMQRMIDAALDGRL